ncbi:hypothetical protein K443DRAFT_12343 [Laccaria amethystina LaAM-08-1]|uniref:Unplaced genomic scaffold K443scaffold_271, whole genome shotgun sequence n=1 Tax=Laccaria amethystina LaAM-08-1 TaxID=1095629 RepID=A0A0C9WJ70_9AGAR|nr:hypothetical protein K443DRAFT_12343 [Laccaria amethystina LaAM-08-1]
MAGLHSSKVAMVPGSGGIVAEVDSIVVNAWGRAPIIARILPEIERIYSMNLEDLMLCDWLFPDSIIGQRGTWKSLKEFLIIKWCNSSTFPYAIITPDYLEWSRESARVPLLETKGITVLQRNASQPPYVFREIQGIPLSAAEIV